MLISKPRNLFRKRRLKRRLGKTKMFSSSQEHFRVILMFTQNFAFTSAPFLPSSYPLPSLFIILSNKTKTGKNNLTKKKQKNNNKEKSGNKAEDKHESASVCDTWISLSKLRFDRIEKFKQRHSFIQDRFKGIERKKIKYKKKNETKRRNNYLHTFFPI